jgi:hypothetical protein
MITEERFKSLRVGDKAVLGPELLLHHEEAGYSKGDVIVVTRAYGHNPIRANCIYATGEKGQIEKPFISFRIDEILIRDWWDVWKVS